MCFLLIIYRRSDEGELQNLFLTIYVLKSHFYKKLTIQIKSTVRAFA